jgi:gingipain R
MKLKVLKKAVISIKTEGVGFANILSTQKPRNAAFEELYSSAFVNYSAPEGFSAASADSKRLIAVVPAQFENLIGDWVAYKTSRGYNVTVKVITNESASDIQKMFQEIYNQEAFYGAVLFGDVDTMPTLTGKYEGAYSDRVYMRLSGNDNYPDAFISRVSGNADEIKIQLDKFVKYEKNGKSGDWYKQGLTVASNEGSPVDYERANWLINGGGKGQKQPVENGGLKGAGFTKFHTAYAPSGSKASVSSAVHEGVGIICYIGHGSTTSWATTGFSTYDVKGLQNGEMLPVIWSVACVNGKFQVRECFAEAWLRQANGGAVAMEAASTNEAWVPPCDKQAATVNAYINNSHRTFGALEMAGLVRALEVWGDGNSSQGNQLAEQCNLFGDCSMDVHYPTKN